MIRVGFMSLRPITTIAVALAITTTIFIFSRKSPYVLWHPTNGPPRGNIYLNLSSNFFIPDGNSSISGNVSSILREVFNETLGVSSAYYLPDPGHSCWQFEKIFVVSLPTRSDHRDSMTLAAHFTGLRVEFIDGVTSVVDKTLPPHPADLDLSQPALGAWRAHMNIARKMVAQGISTALILEDDVDWDLRIKSQMQKFALASRVLLQPRKSAGRGQYKDPTYPRHGLRDRVKNFQLSDADEMLEPTSSPYGDIDQWDILWLGHCGTRFPNPEDRSIPLGRVAYADETVPESQHFGLQFGNKELVEQYPNHTRAVHRVANNLCTLGYALTLTAARRMIYEFSISKISSAMDVMLSWMCEGRDDRKMRTCLSVQPQFFQHHRAVGPKNAQSDISGRPDEYNSVAFSRNIRWSTRINLPKLVDGKTDYIDSFPNGAQAVDLGF